MDLTGFTGKRFCSLYKNKHSLQPQRRLGDDMDLYSRVSEKSNKFMEAVPVCFLCPWRQQWKIRKQWKGSKEAFLLCTFVWGGSKIHEECVWTQLLVANIRMNNEKLLCLCLQRIRCLAKEMSVFDCWQWMVMAVVAHSLDDEEERQC